jgi:hypothetical protein
VDRRGFLISGLAAAGAPALAATPPPAVVFERADPAAAAFGDAGRRAGARAWSIDGDVTDLWFRELQPRWAEAPFPLAGLTFYPALFCLERLAWDHGLRLKAFATHGASHRVTLAARPRQFGAALNAAGARWPAALAAALLDPRIGRIGRPSSPPPNSTDLVSWLIAPR